MKIDDLIPNPEVSILKISILIYGPIIFMKVMKTHKITGKIKITIRIHFININIINIIS